MKKRENSEALNFMLRSAQDEYRQVVLERRGMQYGLVKQYLWLSTLLGSGAFALWTRPVAPGMALSVLVCLGLSLLASFVAFVISMLCLKGRGLGDTPYDRGWDVFADLLYKGHTLESIQFAMLQRLSALIREAYDLTTSRALRLRWVCRLLLLSAAALVFAATLYGWGLHHV